MVLTMPGHSWTGMMTRTGMTMVGMTTGPGVLEVAPLILQFCHSLSNQLHPTTLPRAQIVSLVCNLGLHLHQMCLCARLSINTSRKEPAKLEERYW